MVQEIKASNALDALKKISAPTSRVIRNGITIVVPSNEIVLGDVVYIEDGSIVPADLRLIESNNLKIQEASLTGESVPVQKHANMVFDEKTPIGDQKNMCFSSSIVTYGNGIGVVVNIGMYTEVGKIAKMLNEQVATESPIKKKLNKVGKILSIIGAIAAVVVLSIGFATLKE
jgi:Ca2+-transporting ATPase